jgi:ATP-dependent RNA helicase RhlE
MQFSDLGLNDAVLKGVEAMGYTEPTPIQRDAIPYVLDGRDVVGAAQTGTGKTAAFILPMLQRIPKGQGVTALVVSPTRELALQIEEVAKTAAKYTGHRVTCVVGGVGYDPQVQAIRKGVDLLVATPGRLLDIQRRGDVKLDRVQILVLDEADRMLDMGFWPDVRKIVALLPQPRQTLLFSATMSPEVLRVIGSTLHDPIEVSVARQATPAEAIEQAIYPVDQLQKNDLLAALLKQHDHWDRVLVFSRTKHRADRVQKVLERDGIRAAVMHSNRTQAQRIQALDGFKSGKYRVLIATDIVARGIDVEDISHVVNFDMPSHPEDYVHRIGRTARAGASGSAASFMSPEEMPLLRDIENLIDQVIPTRDLEGFPYRERLVPDAERSAKKVARTVFGGRVMGRRGGRGRKR